MDATNPDRPLLRRRHALAGVLLMALWLGWTLPALWAQATALDAPLMCSTAVAEAPADLP